MAKSKKKNTDLIFEKIPSVYRYEDYRTYLRDVSDHLKNLNPDFSFRKFSKSAGFESPNYLKMVIDNHRNLTNKSIEMFAKVLNLNSGESVFFEALVHFTQAKNAKAKNFHYEQMKKCRGFVEVKEFDRDQFDFFSNWYITAVREVIALQDFVEDWDWISKRVRPSISITKAKEAVELLLRINLLKRSEKGRLEQSQATLVTSPEVRSLAVTNFHRQMLAQAAQSIDEVPSEKRDITALTIGVSDDQIELVKKRILEFRRGLLAEIGQSGVVADEVYELTVQFFPLSQKQKEKK